jgi:hypothetical protein
MTRLLSRRRVVKIAGEYIDKNINKPSNGE